VICAAPSPTPVANPATLSIVATAGAELAQVKPVPAINAPLLSFATAENCWVPFTATDAGEGATVMVATALTVAVTGGLVTPSADAVTCAVPCAKPVASPVLALIETTFVALLAQVKDALVMVLPFRSFAVAENCCVPFTANNAGEGVTATLATETTVTTSGALVTPLALAVIWLVPGATPVASPEELLIVMTLVVSLAHVKVKPVMAFPLLSVAVVENCSVAFTATDTDEGVTAMDASVGVELEAADLPQPAKMAQVARNQSSGSTVPGITERNCLDRTKIRAGRSAYR
jgi:hypothetical protein